MSVLVSRTYIIPIERLVDAFAAAVEIAPRRREPREFSITLLDGSSVSFPFKPLYQEPPYAIGSGDIDSLEFLYGVRAAGGDDVEAYLRVNPEPPFNVKRLKRGGLVVVASLWLSVRTEPPYASFGFQAEGDSCDVLSLPSVCGVLDYIDQCAGGLVTYRSDPDGSFLISPFEVKLPVFEDDDEGEKELTRIVEYVRMQGRA